MTICQYYKSCASFCYSRNPMEVLQFVCSYCGHAKLDHVALDNFIELKLSYKFT